MELRQQRAGFTMIELMVIVVVIAALVGLGGMSIQGWLANQRAKAAARSIANLFSLARIEAVRVRDNHIVFLNLDASGTALGGAEGDPVAALLIRDADGNGVPAADEYVASVPFESTGSLSWGSSFALAGGSEVPAPNDNPSASFPLPNGFGCCTFTQPGGGAARWVAFLPDGMPRAFSVGPFSNGSVGTGNGAVYLTSGERDYAVVLAALGGVRVHSFGEGNRVWSR